MELRNPTTQIAVAYMTKVYKMFPKAHPSSVAWQQQAFHQQPTPGSRDIMNMQMCHGL
jgi:hypothetical protein